MKKLASLLMLLLIYMTARAQKNVIVVTIDDASWNQIIHRPSYVELPGFDLIMENGLTTKASSATSICNPVRVSILTGLYSFQHGAYDNSTPPKNGLISFLEAFSDNGYYTARLGKETNTTKHKAETWMDKHLIIKVIDYTDGNWFPKNGKKMVIQGHTIQITNDTMVVWLSTMPSPFCFWLGYISPHTAAIPTLAHKDEYLNEFIPLTEEFERFATDYPSWIYDEVTGNFYNPEDTNKLKKTIRKGWESLRDVSDGLVSMWEILENRGLLDSTIILFMSDHGYLFGEYQLKGKSIPYDEVARSFFSIKDAERSAPFIPKDTIIEDIGIEMVDIGVSLMDLAGISHSGYSNQSKGTPLRLLLESQPIFSLQYERKIKKGYFDDESGETDSVSPSYWGITSKFYKFIRYGCDSPTYELFDLVMDPEERVNQARNPAYEEVFNNYEFKLDSMKVAIGDTLTIDTFPRRCNLIPISSPKYLGLDATPEVWVYPNPTDSELRIRIKQGAVVEIWNSYGQKINQFMIEPTRELVVPTDQLTNGIYFLKIKEEGYPFIVQH